MYTEMYTLCMGPRKNTYCFWENAYQQYAFFESNKT